jgi:hypothetical protein
VLRERARQVRDIGFDDAHDDDHKRAELTCAAVNYATAAAAMVIMGHTGRCTLSAPFTRDRYNIGWPWDLKWWKPSTIRRMLIKACAMLIAEIERLDRLECERVSDRFRFHADTLGRVARDAWIEWAKNQPNPKPVHLLPYDQLPEGDKEADRQIGEAVARHVLCNIGADYHL